jgi:hypothetical protein
MALRELVNETELKSLKYGFDAFGGGASSQPYIVTDINTQKVILPYNITTTNLLGKDAGFIRGGFDGAAKASIIDTVRVGKWLLDNPLWIAKQVGLQLSNPKLEVPKNLSLITNIGNALSLGTSGLIQPTRIYNLGINTLAQIPVNAFGIHFNRHGLGPVMDDNQKYEAIVRANNDIFGSSNSNRLISLKSKLKVGNLVVGSPPPVLTGIVGAVARFSSSSVNSILSKLFGTDVPIDDYITGPGSVYGIGSTTIRRYQNTSTGAKGGEINKEFLLNGRSAWNNNTAVTDINYGNGKNIPLVSNFFGLSNNIIASENQLGPNRELVVPKLPDYTDKTLASNGNTAVDYNKASPSLRKYSDLFSAIKTNISQSMSFSDAKNYESSDYSGVPKHPFSNERKIFTTIAPDTTVPNRGASDFRYYGNKEIGDQGSKAKYSNTGIFDRYDSDILTVMFRAVDPFTLNEERFAFSAYISDYRDTFDATWTDINYIGRSEPFYIYSKFKRSVSFNLKIPCFNRTQLFEKHRALGQLASTTAGTYDNRSGKTNALGGVLIRLNVGNYLVGEYATMNSLNYSIPNDATWDITPEARLAMYIDASFQFNIVHQILPQYEPSATVGGNSKPVGFFGYLPDTQARDKKFLAIPGREKLLTDPNDSKNKNYTIQDSITDSFTINLVDPIYKVVDGKKQSLVRGTKLAEKNPQPVAGDKSRLVNPK